MSLKFTYQGVALAHPLLAWPQGILRGSQGLFSAGADSVQVEGEGAAGCPARSVAGAQFLGCPSVWGVWAWLPAHAAR